MKSQADLDQYFFIEKVEDFAEDLSFDVGSERTFDFIVDEHAAVEQELELAEEDVEDVVEDVVVENDDKIADL